MALVEGRLASAPLRLDVFLTLSVASVTLPAPAERALAVVGTAFGAPLPALGAAPLLCAAAAAPARGDGALPLAAGFAVALAAAHRAATTCSSPGSSRGRAAGRLDRSKAAVLLTTGGALAVANALGGRDALGGASFMQAALLAAFVAVSVPKELCARVRPCCGPLAARLALVPRVCPLVARAVSRPGEDRRSFPSGDAAGSAAFAVVMGAVAPGAARLWALLAVLSALGRVYFHAHHALDVAAGAALGAATARAVLLAGDGDPRGFGVAHVLAGVAGLVVVAEATKLGR